MSGEDWSDREIDRGAALDREVDRLRGVYRDHAETLSKLAATSPSKQLARRYQELVADINKAILGLDQVGPDAEPRSKAGQPVPTPAIVPPEEPPRPPAPPPPAASTKRPEPPPERPVLSSYSAAAPSEEEEEGTLLRIALIIGLAIVLLGVLALFVWKFSGDRPQPAVSEPTPPAISTTTPPEESTVAPVSEPKPRSPLSVSPQQHDFGTIAKGTSAVRTFEVSNAGRTALTLEISRSKCRCLWYDPPASVPAGGRGTLTVRVDGGRAPAGALTESIEISANGKSDAVAVIEITAEVK